MSFWAILLQLPFRRSGSSWFSPWSMGYLVSGFRPPVQCWVWVRSDIVGLLVKSDIGWNGNYWPSPHPGVTFCLELQCAFILGCPQPLQYHLNTWPTRPSVFLLSPVTDKSLLLAAKRRVKPETSRLSILSIHLRSWKNHHSTRERKCGGKRNLTVLRMLQMS